MAPAPQAIDLAVLKRLSEEAFAADIGGAATVRRLWEACSLPDFRQLGVDNHARFVARLWQDLRGGHLGADFVAARIAELDSVQGDIDTLQGRIAAVRSWAYICQRPDWVLARDEMAARAQGVEARLSDALHARLTERFVNRRTAILMKSVGTDPALLPVTLDDDGRVAVEGEPIGRIDGFRFSVDHRATHTDRKMLLAAGERALPRLLAERARRLIEGGLEAVALKNGRIEWQGHALAVLEAGPSAVCPRPVLARELALLPTGASADLLSALQAWLDRLLEPLAPLAKLEDAARDPEAGSPARALLLNLVAGHGYVARENAGIEHLPKEMRPFLRRLGVIFGALDVFAPALFKPAPRRLLHALGADRRPLQPDMPAVISGGRKLPSGYRSAGEQAVRIDIAEKLLRAAHEARGKGRQRPFALDPALAVSTGLTPANHRRLLGAAGFRVQPARRLAAAAHGPPAPDRWHWRPAPRKPERSEPPRPREGGAFAALADLVG